MKTYCTFAVASLVLATATGAMAAPPNAHSDNTASPLTTEAVIADLVASRQAAPMQTPRDGEWYNVPAPLGGMAQKVRNEDTASAQAMPEKPADMELSRK